MKADCRWQIFLNQPSSAVLEAVRQVEDAFPSVELFDAPFPPLAEKERWMELRQLQLDALPPTAWGVIWDDDHVLADPAEASRLLAEDWDLIYATKLFFWNDDEHFTTHLPEHRSVFFFRRLPSDRFPTDRVIHAPVRIHDTARRITDLHGPLLDYGYMDEGDRQRCWADYKRAGKIDAATLALVRRPTLHTWPGPFPLRHVQAP